ncbi:MAG: biopolymer transporter ExbD [Gammaproteobacteria bacterium]|nr:biopolymer transporter ExbD [Gammaproteobacteria bacterium]
MMKMSRRARRMERHHARRKQPALNLVSLMDIFTILVFFLLVSSSSVQNLPSSKDINLPTSVAKKAPKETLIITVTAKDILVQGRKVGAIDQVLASEELLIPGLEKELKFQSTKSMLAQADKTRGRAVTIMGDEQLPYELLRKILSTCRQANYTRIAFAAVQKSKGTGS